MVTLHPPRQLLIELQADVRVLAGIRDQLRGWLAGVGVDGEACEELLLVATELCTNAIEATRDGEPVEVRVGFDDGALRFEVANAVDRPDGPLPPELRRGSLQERGRGLAIVRALVDTVAVSTIDGRRIVRTTRFF